MTFALKTILGPQFDRHPTDETSPFVVGTLPASPRLNGMDRREICPPIMTLHDNDYTR